MPLTADDLNRVVILRTAQGEPVATGRMISHTDAPTVAVETDDGRQVNWRADLGEVLTPEAEAEYWRARAERAERSLKGLKLGGAVAT